MSKPLFSESTRNQNKRSIVCVFSCKSLIQLIYIDATKKFNISLTEKWFAHFRLSKASVWLASVTP
ncbi:hypothetical protein ETC02_02990 [Geobacillus sp. DSP4a]|nr:hypothetical protein [Geobacillus sp. DSP4a]